MKVPFCTCVDHECRCNPLNHPHGCTPCIAKCLAENEIPVCFYRKIEPNMDRKQDYTFKGFANFVIDHEKSRCYLLARFKLQNGDQRYLLEIDTSDNRKTMSTRIMGFKAGVEAGKCIDRILRETVKGSLRWPGTMAKYCEPLHSVHHPKESSSGANHARVFDWKQRIRAALG